MELSTLIINERRWSYKHPSLWADAVALLYGGIIGCLEARGYHIGSYTLFLPILPRVAYEALASYIRNTSSVADMAYPTKTGNKIFIESLAAGSIMGSSLAALESGAGATIGINLF